MSRDDMLEEIDRLSVCVTSLGQDLTNQRATTKSATDRLVTQSGKLEAAYLERDIAQSARDLYKGERDDATKLWETNCLDHQRRKEQIDIWSTEVNEAKGLLESVRAARDNALRERGEARHSVRQHISDYDKLNHRFEEALKCAKDAERERDERAATVSNLLEDNHQLKVDVDKKIDLATVWRKKYEELAVEAETLEKTRLRRATHYSNDISSLREARNIYKADLATMTTDRDDFRLMYEQLSVRYNTVDTERMKVGEELASERKTTDIIVKERDAYGDELDDIRGELANVKEAPSLHDTAIQIMAGLAADPNTASSGAKGVASNAIRWAREILSQLETEKR